MKRSYLFKVNASSVALLRTYALFYWVFGVVTLSLAQSTAPINQTGTNTYSDTLQCNGAPTFSVNLTGQPAGVWISDPQKREGDCCNPMGDNNCVQFSVLLDPASEGIVFSVPDGCGAAPSGSLFYQVDCGPLTSVGTPLCLNGSGPFVITFCKPGNNENCYSIASIPAPYSGGDVITADGCKDTLTAQGLQTASVSWTSISPGLIGQYNHYLNNVTSSQPGISGVPYTGQTTVVVTPQTGYPSVVYFQVCGLSLGGCSTSTFCDTVSVTIYPNLFVSAGLDVAICNGSVVGTVVTGTAMGGTAPYTYTWTGPNGFSQTITTNAITCPIVVPLPGVYTLSLTDITGCPAATDQVNVVPFTSDIVANAGPDQSTCGFPVPTVSLLGSVTQTNTGIWSGGTGNYSLNVTDLNVQYTPSSAELAAGYVTLTLTPTNVFGCPYVKDSITITLPQFAGIITSAPSNSVCNGSSNGAIDVSIIGGMPIASYQWSNGVFTEDIMNLSPGSYTLIVTDLNGCSATLTEVITEPPAIVISVTTVDAICFGAASGGAGVVVAGGIAGYNLSWTGPLSDDPTGLEVSTSGGNYQISQLLAGDYNLTVIDLNGCVQDVEFSILQPTNELFASFQAQNVSCFGAADGGVIVTANGGTPGYNVSWLGGVSGNPVGIEMANEGDSFTINQLSSGSFFVTVTDAFGCTIKATVAVASPPRIIGTAIAENPSCFGVADGYVTIQAVGGIGDFLYSINNTVLQPSNYFSGLSGSMSGTPYSVTISDANGCTEVIGFVLYQAPQLLISSLVPAVFAGGFNVSGCADNGSVDLTAIGGTGALSFLWSPGSSTSEDISGLASGTYSVLVTDENGCQVSSSVVLHAPPLLSCTTEVISNYNGQDISCAGFSDGAIEASLFGGVPPLTISWTNASSATIGTSTALFGLQQGQYILVAEDINGCQISDTINVIDPPPMSVAIAVSSSYNGADVSCFSASDGTIELQVAGGTPSFTFLWTNALGVQVSILEDPMNLSAGSYGVTVQDLNGCLIDTAITITQPIIISGQASVTSNYNGADVSCFQSMDGVVNVTASGGILPYSYSWMSSSGAFLGDNQELNNIGAGLFLVTITDVNGCTMTTNVSVSQPEIVSSTVVIVTDYFGMPVSCTGEFDGSAVVTPSGGVPDYTYSWNTIPIQNTAFANGLGEGMYSVVVTDANGCESTNSVQLSANPLPQITLPPPISGCIDVNFSLLANIPFGGTCTWYFTNGQVVNDCGPVSLSFSEAGCIGVELKVVSFQGCVNSISADSLICISPNPTAGFTVNTLNPTTANPGVQFTNTSEGATTYEWTFGDYSSLSYQQHPFHVFTGFSDFETSAYLVMLKAYSSEGCVDTALLWIHIDPELIFYVPNAFTPDDDQYNQLFKPVFSSGFSAKNYSFTIYNRWGELIFETDQIDEGWDGTYKNMPCQDDVYTWKIRLMNAVSGRRKEYVGHVTLLK
jgi:gliding motility-associated-like protein